MKSILRGYALTFGVLQMVALWDYVIRLEHVSRFWAGDPLGCLLSSAVPVAIVSSLVFFLGEYAWMPLLCIFLWTVCCTAVEGVMRLYFSGYVPLSGAFAMRLQTISWEKLVDFLSSWGWCHWLFVACFVLFVLAGVSLLIVMRVSTASLKTVIVGAVVVAGMSFLMPRILLKDHFCPALMDHLFLGGYRDMEGYRLVQAGKPLEDPDRYCATETNLLAVLVVGESSSARHWSMYGYARDTTPRLNAIRDELVVFSSVTSTCALTRIACLDTFAWKENDRELSLTSVSSAVGYDNAIVGIQPPPEKNEGVDELLFRQCRHRKYFNEVGQPKVWDDAAIPEIAKLITDVSSNQFVVVHTYGSHTEWNEQYPPNFRRFHPDFVDQTVSGLEDGKRRDVNHYDNTIFFTDAVLADFIETVRKTGRKAVLIYISDHGETPRTFARDEKCPDELYSIPFLVWASPAFVAAESETMNWLRERANNRLSSKDCPPILLKILGIRKRNEAR